MDQMFHTLLIEKLERVFSLIDERRQNIGENITTVLVNVIKLPKSFIRHRVHLNNKRS